MIRYYVAPMIGSGTNHLDPWRPAYFSEMGIQVYYFDYGALPQALVIADTTDQQDTDLTAHTDVTAFPSNIDQQIGGSLQTVRSKLEANGIPANWVQAGDTFRTLLRSIIGLMLFGQRYTALYNVQLPIVGASSLDLRWNQLSTTDQQRFLATGTDLGFDLSWVANNTQLRQILKWLADQWGSRPFQRGGVTI